MLERGHSAIGRTFFEIRKLSTYSIGKQSSARWQKIAKRHATLNFYNTAVFCTYHWEWRSWRRWGWQLPWRCPSSGSRGMILKMSLGNPWMQRIFWFQVSRPYPVAAHTSNSTKIPFRNRKLVLALLGAKLSDCFRNHFLAELYIFCYGKKLSKKKRSPKEV